jgi:hypothetical protein
MARYIFELRTGEFSATVDDQCEFTSDEAVIEYGRQVAHELMRNRCLQARRWRLDIHNADGEYIACLPFAQLDPTLDHLVSPARGLVERWSEACLALAETVSAARQTARESRSLVARSRGKPYLVAVHGEPVLAQSRGHLSDRAGGSTLASGAG